MSNDADHKEFVKQIALYIINITNKQNKTTTYINRNRSIRLKKNNQIASNS